MLSRQQEKRRIMVALLMLIAILSLIAGQHISAGESLSTFARPVALG